MSKPKRPLPTPTESCVARFHRQYTKDGKCWEWARGRNRRGYGVFWLGDSQFAAPRVAYLIAFGVDPGKRLVCHRCDNPPCVRPEHLFLGTAADNAQDRDEKGRGRIPRLRGNDAFNSKITEIQVMEIRRAWATGKVSQRDLGAKYGLARTSIMSIVTGKNWQHLPVIKSDLNHKSLKHKNRRQSA